MSDMNNGYERTLDINILTYINGVNTGSIVESGLGIFPDSGMTSYSGNTYGAITILEMEELDEASYEQRMNDFCDYLQLKYNGLIISNRAVNGNTTDNAPRRINSGACPITIAKHDITISNSLVYSYGITSDIQNINMSSTDSWIINGLPSIISVTPTSGDSTTTQLQCTRTNWGNDTLTIQNLNNNQVASCTIQALYLDVSQHTVSLSDTNSGVTIGVSIAGGLDNYNVITSGDTGYFTVTQGIYTSGNTLTETNITVTSIPSPQNRTLTITLQHVSNSLVKQTINVTYTPKDPIYANLSKDLNPDCGFCYHGNKYSFNIYTDEGYVHPGATLYYYSDHKPVTDMALVTDLISYNGIKYAYAINSLGVVQSMGIISWTEEDPCPFTC
jgi:hypothetical protein